MTADERTLGSQVVVAETVASGHFGGDVRLSGGNNLGGSDRSKVFRLRVVDGPAGTPESVVVKAVLESETYDPESPEGSAAGLFNDWAGYEFLTRQLGEASPAPAFYGGDRDAGVIVIEDLGPGTQLDHLLLGDDWQAAEEGLVALAAALGEMHAATVGKKAEFDSLREGLGPTGADTYGSVLEHFDSMVESLDLEPQSEARQELAAVVEELEDPGPFWPSHTEIHARTTACGLTRACGCSTSKGVNFATRSGTASTGESTSRRVGA